MTGEPIGDDNRQLTVDDLALACEALAALVREEYPEQYTLAQIAATWGGATPKQVAALEAYAAGLAEATNG